MTGEESFHSCSLAQMFKTIVQEGRYRVRMTNREALLEAAVASLQDKGYADTTAREVASRAQVSLGAIGYHFGSLQELLDLALAEAVRNWLEPLIGLLSEPKALPGIQQLGPPLEGLLGTLDANRPLVIAYFEALLRAERSPDLRSSLAGDFHALRTTLTCAIEQILADQPRAPAPDPQAAASLIMATFDGLIMQWLIDPQRVPSGHLIAETLQRAATFVSADPALASS